MAKWPSKQQFDAVVQRVQTLENTGPTASTGITETAPWAWIDLYQRDADPADDGYTLDGDGTAAVQTQPAAGVIGALVMTLPAGTDGYAEVLLPDLLSSPFGELQVRMALIGGNGADASVDIGVLGDIRGISVNTHYGFLSDDAPEIPWNSTTADGTWETWRFTVTPTTTTARRGNGERITMPTPEDWSTSNARWRINLAGTAPAEAEVKLLVDYAAWRPVDTEPLNDEAPPILLG